MYDRQGSDAPFRDSQRKRWNRRLGNFGGIKNYGVNFFLRLEPGGHSSAGHAHTKQDEFVYVIEGEVRFCHRCATRDRPVGHLHRISGGYWGRSPLSQCDPQRCRPSSRGRPHALPLGLQKQLISVSIKPAATHMSGFEPKKRHRLRRAISRQLPIYLDPAYGFLVAFSLQGIKTYSVYSCQKKKNKTKEWLSNTLYPPT